MKTYSLLRYLFSKRLNIKSAGRYCSKLKMNREAGKTDGAGQLRLSCVQRRIRPVKNAKEYIEMMNDFVQQAAYSGSDLVIFPEYNFFDLLGLIPGFRLADSCLTKKASSSETAADGEGNYALIASVFGSIADSVENFLFETMSALAEGWGLYVYSGSYIQKEGDKLYNAGALFSPEGRHLGTQKKLHLTDFEEKLGLKRGDSINTFEINGIKTAFPICMDATYFETFRILRRLGVDIAALPIANNEEYSRWRALRGLWPRVQESHIYGAKSALNGWFAGMHFTGRAGIFAPIELTADRSGVLAITSDSEGDSIISETLEMERLNETRSSAEYFGDANTEYEKNYCKIYDYRRGENENEQ